MLVQMDSSSPDEKALSYFAQYMGFELFERAGGNIRLRFVVQSDDCSLCATKSGFAMATTCILRTTSTSR